MFIVYRDVRHTPVRCLPRTAIALVASLVVLVGCQGQPRQAATLSETTLQTESPTAQTAVVPATALEPALESTLVPVAIVSDGEKVHSNNADVVNASVTVTELVASAKRLHPTALAIAAARRAADARVTQAGAWANPELTFSYGRTRPRISDIPTDNPYGGSLSQRFEWWGKRQVRLAAAQAQIAVNEAESAVLLLDLEVDVRLAAIAYATARATTEQTAAQQALAQELAEVVAKRQAAGDIDLGEVARVRVEASTARLRHESAQRAVITAGSVLRAWCGESLSEQLIISDVLIDDAPADAAANHLHPRVRAALEMERVSAAQVQAERQNRIPDLTLGIYGDREWEKDTYGVTVGVEIPLWNRNAGGIALADAERQRLLAMRQVEERRLRQAATEALGAWHLAHGQVVLLRNEVLPAAQDAVRLRTTAFQGGDASLADVLDARRALVGAQTDLLDARQRMAEALVLLLATTGTTGGRP